MYGDKIENFATHYSALLGVKGLSLTEIHTESQTGSENPDHHSLVLLCIENIIYRKNISKIHHVKGSQSSINCSL